MRKSLTPTQLAEIMFMQRQIWQGSGKNAEEAISDTLHAIANKLCCDQKERAWLFEESGYAPTPIYP